MCVGEEMKVQPLTAGQLYRKSDLSALTFTTTAELELVEGLVGQARALDAIRFGMQVAKDSFNLFVIGPEGARMQQAVKALLTARADDTRPGSHPSDWIYVNNFENAECPIAISLPARRGPPFQAAMQKLIDDLKSALPTIFQSEEYQTRRGAINDAFEKRQAEAFAELHKQAAEKDVAILRTPMGFALAPAKDGQVVPPEEFNHWPEEKRQATKATIETLEEALEHIVHQVPNWQKEQRDQVRQLNRETTEYAVDPLIEDIRKTFDDIPRIIQYIHAVRTDLVDNVEVLVAGSQEEPGAAALQHLRLLDPFNRYDVNVLVAQDDHGLPIVEELHPTLGNLIGRIEHIAVQGALVTNFRLIRAGALHRANGGYLLLDARHLLTEPFSWAALKRTLKRGKITIEDAAQLVGLTNAVSLEPDPVPLNVKVVLFGDRRLYFLLSALDPELRDYFKVLADFEDDLPRTPENEAVLARLVATMARQDELRALDREAVALMLEHASRLADHAGKLSLIAEDLREVLIEADLRAENAGRDVIDREDIDGTLAARITRAARLRDRTQEGILERVSLIDTEGMVTGQINGLSVTRLGGFSFGRPTRITCQIRPGSGKVVDIEREVELGGPLHSKGVLILSGFLAGRYALDAPMSLFASLVFEQSYGGVEGDSASSAELYTLLSALAAAPLRQDLAVTGSVNQLGEVQAIGGVNEKIEGFFDICLKRGLTGTQGVLIPKANVLHLMLRRDVREACEARRFAIYSVGAIDEGIALLTGLHAGKRGSDGSYPESSLNRRVEDRLRAFATIRREFARQEKGQAPK